MTIPKIFQNKAMTIKLLISTAFGVLFAAILFVYFDKIKVSNFQEFKNETLVLGKKIDQEYTRILLPGSAVGPESFSFDGSGGGPYTGVSDGRIIRWLANESRWVDFAVTTAERYGCEGPHDHSETEDICGRPLGLIFVEKMGLFIADAYMGLLSVGPNGGLASPLTKGIDGVPFMFVDSLDVDQDSGVVYFTDSSTRYQRRDFVSPIITDDNTGRLLKFELQTRKTTILLDNLKFPNGVALSKNRDFLLFGETTTCKLFKFWLKTPKAGNLELITEFDGFPDNIKRNRNGEFWVAINARRGIFLKWIISNSWIGKVIVRVLPVKITKIFVRLIPLIPNSGTGIKLNADGEVVEMLDSRWESVSEVNEENGNLWIGSVTDSSVVKVKISIFSE